MDYKQAVSYLQNFKRFTQEPGVVQTARLLNLLGNPNDTLKFVHITGTNGKGSTAAFTASILQAAGYKVGLFTSPHIHSYTERIRINQKNISETRFALLLENIKTHLDHAPDLNLALFDVLTVMAFLHFRAENVDIVVLEVGIGGRLDSTNVIQSLVSVITNIGLDHGEILGKTKEKIAIEKAGIIKSKSIALTAESDPHILKILQQKAVDVGARFMALDVQEPKLIKRSMNGQIFHFKSLKNLEISLLGEYQLYNASLAILCSLALVEQGFIILEEHIREGLRQCKWPLRFEIICRSPFIVLDGGHNLEGIQFLPSMVEEFFGDIPQKKRVLILGHSEDKPYGEMAQQLSHLAETIILTRASHHGVEPKKIALHLTSKKRAVHLTPDVQSAVLMAKQLAPPDGLMMIFGSLYLAAEARGLLSEYFDLGKA